MVTVDPLYSIYPPKFRWLIFPLPLGHFLYALWGKLVHLTRSHNKTSPSVSFVFIVDLLLTVICREPIRLDRETNWFPDSHYLYNGIVLRKKSHNLFLETIHWRELDFLFWINKHYICDIAKIINLWLY